MTCDFENSCIKIPNNFIKNTFLNKTGTETEQFLILNKYFQMKRKIVFIISFLLIMLSFNSCETLGSCKVCRQVTYEIGGGVISEGPETEYCDAALIGIETTDDIFVNNTRISWECR
jgi:hypothetical protein